LEKAFSLHFCFSEISTISKTIKGKAIDAHASAWALLNLFDRLGSREPQKNK
jgi:hypothetical protein